MSKMEKLLIILLTNHKYNSTIKKNTQFQKKESAIY